MGICSHLLQHTFLETQILVFTQQVKKRLYSALVVKYICVHNCSIYRRKSPDTAESDFLSRKKSKPKQNKNRQKASWTSWWSHQWWHLPGKRRKSFSFTQGLLLSLSTGLAATMVCKHGFDIDIQFTAYKGMFPKELEKFWRHSE